MKVAFGIWHGTLLVTCLSPDPMTTPPSFGCVIDRMRKRKTDTFAKKSRRIIRKRSTAVTHQLPLRQFKCEEENERNRTEDFFFFWRKKGGKKRAFIWNTKNMFSWRIQNDNYNNHFVFFFLFVVAITFWLRLIWILQLVVLRWWMLESLSQCLWFSVPGFQNFTTAKQKQN